MLYERTVFKLKLNDTFTSSVQIEWLSVVALVFVVKSEIINKNVYSLMPVSDQHLLSFRKLDSYFVLFFTYTEVSTGNSNNYYFEYICIHAKQYCRINCV